MIQVLMTGREYAWELTGDWMLYPSVIVSFSSQPFGLKFSLKKAIV